MKHVLLTLILLFALPALPDRTQAQTQLTPEEFEALSEGRTFFYSFDGEDYGVEEYLPGRRVLWSYLDGDCHEGRWYADLGLVCFVYDFGNEPQCWSFYRDGPDITARFENDPAETTRFGVEETPEPMLCYGPDIGV